MMPGRASFEMSTKKVEDLDFYDLLNLPIDASPAEVEAAYLHALATYHEESLASYGVLSKNERELLLERVETAFLTLSDPRRKKAYDEAILPSRPEFRQKAYFRKSTSRLEIEDAPGEKLLKKKLRPLFSRLFRKKAIAAREKIQGHRFGPEAQSFPYSGEFLKLVRKSRGLSRAQVAASSGLSEELLKAIEEEDYTCLPRGKGVSTLLRLYAGSLGLHGFDGRGKPSPRPLRRT